jgi:hypothetical protein
MNETPDNVGEFDLPAEPALPEEAAGEAGPLSEVDPEKLRILRERLAAFQTNKETTVTGSEDPDALPQSLDLSKFEVEPELEHFYKRAELDKESGAWVVVEHQYMIHTGAWHIDGSGQLTGTNKQGKKLYRAKGLDHIITEIINGPEGVLSRQKGWRLSALLPGAMSQGIAVFERQVRRALPEPKPIVQPDEQPLEKVSDEELVRMNDRAKAWEELSNKMASEGDAQAAREEGTDVQSEG